MTYAIMLKFGEREHMEEFRAGLIYMNPIEYFRRIENDCVRADPLEGLDLIHQPNRIASLKITIDGKDMELASHLTGPFTARRTGNLCNLFCMHGIRTIRPNNSLIDRRNLKFGDSFVMVTHMQEFLNRINVTSKANGFFASWDFVTYYDASSYHGDLGPFHKSSVFAYQSEFRIAIHPGAVCPVRLRLKSLKDITTPVLPLSNINESIRVSRTKQQ